MRSKSWLFSLALLLIAWPAWALELLARKVGRPVVVCVDYPLAPAWAAGNTPWKICKELQELAVLCKASWNLAVESRFELRLILRLTPNIKPIYESNINVKSYGYDPYFK
jgi:hypothetical protein